MSDLNKLLGTITLTQLMEMLREMGILVSSPYEQMLAEERASPSEAPAPPPAPPTAPTAAVPASSSAEPATPPPSAPPATSAAPATPPTPAPAPPRANEAVFAGLLLALSQLGINPNSDASPPAPSGSGTSASASGSQPAAPVAAFSSELAEGEMVAVAAPVPVPAASPSCGGVNKGKGKETGPPPPPQGETLSGFVCAHCKTHNLVRPAKDTWYVVTAGWEVSVFRGWHNVQPLVSGVSGACYKKHPSEDAARIAFAEALAAGHVVQL